MVSMFTTFNIKNISNLIVKLQIIWWTGKRPLKDIQFKPHEKWRHINQKWWRNFVGDDVTCQ